MKNFQSLLSNKFVLWLIAFGVLVSYWVAVSSLV